MEQHLLNIEKTVSHSYLYLHKGIWKEESHEQRIMQQCQIPGTLPFRLIQEEEENIFQYNFSPFERMVDYFSDKRMHLRHILALFESIRDTFLNLEEYLLSPSLLGLQTEEIIYDPENCRFLFPLIPSQEDAVEHAIGDIADFIFDHVDTSDESAILAAFFLQQEKKKKQIQLNRILMLLHAHKKTEADTSSSVKRESSINSRLNPYESGLHSPATEKRKVMEEVCPEITEENCLSPKAEERIPKPPSPVGTEFDLSGLKYDDYLEANKKIEDEQEKRADSPTLSPLPEKKVSRKKPLSKLSFLKSTSPEYKKRISSGKKKLFLCLILMILFPTILYAWKGAAVLIDYLPFVILIEAAILLYGLLDIFT